MITFPDIDAISKGFRFEFPELTEMRNINDWYEGKYNSLLPSPATTLNGLGLLRYTEGDTYYDHLYIIPLFHLASDFIQNAVMSQIPVYTGGDAQVAWLDEHFTVVVKAMRKAAEYWARHDLSVMTAAQDEEGNPQVEAIDPATYIRIGRLSQRDALVGHCLFYPYHAYQSDAELKEHIQRTPNRARVVKLVKGEGVVEEWMYAGNRLTALIQRVPTEIKAICVAGSAESWYPQASDLVAGVCIDYSLIKREIYRFSNKMRFLPASVATHLRELGRGLQLVNQADGYDLTRLQYAIDRIRDIIIPLRENDAEPQLSAQILEIVQQLEMLRFQIDSIYLIGGIPPSSFGIGIGKGESGVAREQGQNAAAARAQAWRRDMQQCLPELCAAAGMPEGEVSFSWLDTPFVNEAARKAEVREDFKLGLLTHNEARQGLGYTESNEVGQQTESEGNNGNAENNTLR